MAIVQVKNLTKRFGKFTAVDNISFSLKAGEILGLLGRNGAGKTTTIQMLLGVLTPTDGQITYFDQDLAKHRSSIMEKVNFSSTYINLPWHLTVRENLTYISYLYTIKDRSKRLNKIKQAFQLEDLWHQPMMELSAGQLTRVNLAKAFINYPQVLLLDEPTASLDVDVADYIRNFLLEERQKFGVSIILTSHNMAEVEEVCDRVLFIDQGKIVADDTPENLARSIKVAHLSLLIKNGLTLAMQYSDQQQLKYKIEGRYIRLDIDEQFIPDFLRGLMDRGVIYTEISIEKPTLEDYFLQVIQQKV